MRFVLTKFRPLTIALAYCQKADQTVTEAELLGLKSGTIIKKEFSTLAQSKGSRVQILKVSDLHSGNGMSALRLTKAVQGPYTRVAKTAALIYKAME